MSRYLPVAVASALLVLVTNAAAQHMHGMEPGAMPSMSPSDSRELLHFPAMMQAHMLANMRNHVVTLDAILSAVAASDFARAAKIARDQLGLASPSAAGCRPTSVGSEPPEPGSMDAMMAQFMPPPVRAIGYAMHTAASDFADAADRAQTTRDTQSVLEALSRITPNCVSCHSAYRLR